MADLYDLQANPARIWKPNGEEVFRSTDRMPAALAVIDKTGASAISLEFPKTSHETTETGGGLLKMHLAAHSIASEQVVQAYSHTVAPTFFMGEVKLTRTTVGNTGGAVGSNYLGAAVQEGVWLPFGGGSLFLEGMGARPFYGFNPISGLNIARWIDFAVVGGNVVIQRRQMSSGYSSVWYSAPEQTTRSVWSIEARLICGFFDL